MFSTNPFAFSSFADIGAESTGTITILTGVEATGSVASVSISSTSNVTITGVQSTGEIGTAKPNITKIVNESISATGFINDNFTFIKLISLSGLQVTASAGSSTVNVKEILEAVEATTVVNSVSISNTVTLTGVPAVLSAGAVKLFNSITLTGVPATATVADVIATGVIFDFNAVKDLYDRRRTVYVEAKNIARTVLIQTQNRTVYAEEKSITRTVLVSAENRKVYVERRTTSADRTAEAA